MNSRIYRYRLAITDAPTVLMPPAAQVLSVGPPRDGSDLLDLWALVWLDGTPEENRHFRLVGTGNPMPTDYGHFIGTVPTHEGRFVWHVFEAGMLA